MKPLALRIDHDETDSGKFKVSVSYHERDASDRWGESADIVVYVDVTGRRLPEALPEISAIAVARARQFLGRILNETDEHDA